MYTVNLIIKSKTREMCFQWERNLDPVNNWTPANPVQRNYESDYSDLNNNCTTTKGPDNRRWSKV